MEKYLENGTTFVVPDAQKSAEEFHNLANILAKSKCITSVNLANSMLTPDNLAIILEGLSKNTLVREVNLKGNTLNRKCLVILGGILRSNHVPLLR